METIKITRRITRQVMIGIDELLKEDIPTIKAEDLTLIASKLIDRNHELLEEIKALNLSARHQEGKEPSISPVVNDDTLGENIVKSSKYHFVSKQLRNGKFHTYKVSISIGGKTVNIGTSKDERLCALLADEYLDNIQYTGCKRNYNDFPEIMKLYKVEVENERKANLIKECRGW